ncbi:hypothetical protein BJX76DRAFT_127845 [Aspergillus varians]
MVVLSELQACNNGMCTGCIMNGVYTQDVSVFNRGAKMKFLTCPLCCKVVPLPIVVYKTDFPKTITPVKFNDCWRPGIAGISSWAPDTEGLIASATQIQVQMSSNPSEILFGDQAPVRLAVAQTTYVACTTAVAGPIGYITVPRVFIPSNYQVLLHGALSNKPVLGGTSTPDKGWCNRYLSPFTDRQSKALLNSSTM